jgi:hypothetical protein
MSVKNNAISWFHCGQCATLFRSKVGDLESRVCTECGLDPCLGLDDPADESAIPASLPEYVAEPAKHSRKRRSRRRIPFKLIGAGVLLLCGMLLGAGFILDMQRASVKPSAPEPPAAGPSMEEAVFLSETGPEISRVFFGFLAGGTPEARNQFVLDPIDTASKMARFYDLNPIANIAPETLVSQQSAVLDLPRGRAIETQWKTADKNQIETVFIQQDNEWRLDWDHYVRFSTYPWPLFLAGSGDDVGEFRLLARQRLAEERKNADHLSIVLYAPRFGLGNATGAQSPEFLLERDSANGRLLEAAFELEKDGQRAFGVELPLENPESLIRVRVKVRRVKDEMGSRFELLQVFACHWYSSDESGVKLPTPGPEK